MDFLDDIKQNIVSELNKVLEQELISIDDLVYPPEKNQGDLSLPAFKLAKHLKRSPQDIAQEVGDKMKDNEGFRVEISGPYINFFITSTKLASQLNTILNSDNYLASNRLENKKIMVEFAHPNPFKSFHIGHLRNIILGESLVRLLESQGAEVIRTNYQGDVGMHIAKCLWSFQAVKTEDYPQDIDERVNLLAKCYSEGATAFKEQEQAKSEIEDINKKIYDQTEEKITKLWETGKKWSLDKFEQIYDRLDTSFDRQYMESEVIDDAYKYIQEAQDKGILEKSEGAVIFPGEKYDLENRVFLNSQGLPTYDGKELGLAYKEFTDFGELDLCIHNVAKEQTGFFKVNFKVQELLDPDRFKDKQHHNAYELVGLKQSKMSSRSGNIELAEDILDQAKDKISNIIQDKNKEVNESGDWLEKMGVNAVKFSFLKVSPFKYLAFDIDESVNFSGDSGPYMNYTYTRINSILNKESEIQSNDFELSTEEERQLMLKLIKLPQDVKDSSNQYNPSILLKDLLDLCQLFNDFYHKFSVLDSESKVKNTRLALLKSVKAGLEQGAYLLGMDLVEEM